MEPETEQNNRPLRILTGIFIGLLASAASIAFFLFVAWAIFVALTNAISFESGGSIALVVDMVCVAPLALLLVIPVGVFAGKFAYKKFSRIETTRGSRVARKISFIIFGVAGLCLSLAALTFVIYQIFPLIPKQERETLAQLGIADWQSPCHRKSVTCKGNFLSAQVTGLRIAHRLKNIPPEITQLSRLETLSLSRNTLSAVPPELSRLTRLRVLDLSLNQLKHLPPELGRLSSLRTLKLSNNQLTDIPPELGDLSHLDSLSLSKNQLRHIPPELGNLSSLRNLKLDDNQLVDLPPELGKLHNLAYLNAENNQLRRIPPELGALSKLTSLDLSSNQLSGNIPAELGALSSLKHLKLQNNLLTGIPPELGHLSRLIWFKLSNNQLNGPLPPELGKLSSLHGLELAANPLSGSLPPEITALSHLNTFAFNDTNLCEPQDPAFQKWLSGIKKLKRTEVACP